MRKRNRVRVTIRMSYVTESKLAQLTRRLQAATGKSARPDDVVSILVNRAYEQTAKEKLHAKD